MAWMVWTESPVKMVKVALPEVPVHADLTERKEKWDSQEWTAELDHKVPQEVPVQWDIKDQSDKRECQVQEARME